MTKRVTYAVLVLILIGCDNAAEVQADSESGLEFEKIAILEQGGLEGGIPVIGNVFSNHWKIRMGFRCGFNIAIYGNRRKFCGVGG